MATYRTRTYLAADWDGDKNAIDKLHEWNDGEKWSLSFTDAHDLTQSSDDRTNVRKKRPPFPAGAFHIIEWGWRRACQIRSVCQTAAPDTRYPRDNP